jgi:SPP1 gp7 family putative phage head morphogenesis protein
MAFDIEQLLLRLDDGTAIAGIMRRRFVQAVKLGFTDSAETWEFDVAFDLDNPLIQEFLDELANDVRRVSDTTKDEIRALVGKMADEGWSLEDLAKEIEKIGEVNSKSRARAIASYESATAYSRGAIASYKEAGAKGKEWLGNDPCEEICQKNDGVVVGLDENFPSGHFCPAGHPYCECAMLPVI